jgi:hypothetical protein
MPPHVAAVAPAPFDVEELTLLLNDRAPTAQERTLGAQLVANDPKKAEALVDALLADDAFIKTVGPRIIVGPRLLGLSPYVQPTNWVLLSDTQGGEPVYHLKWAPKCAAREAVRVAAWWNPAKPVLICASSYRPERFTSPRSGKACDAFGPVVDADSDCGCGPNLVRCLPDERMWGAVTTALTSETRATIAHLLAENAPIQSVFTTNATARTRYAELIYRRWVVEDKKLSAIPNLDELQTWSLDQPRWAERAEAVPGQHAGILTDPNTAFNSNGLRALMRVLQDVMWCVGEDSSSVDTAVVLTLGKEIRGADGTSAGSGWEKLAARRVCTNCHARLDYSARAWLGYPDQRVALHFVSSKQLSAKAGGTGPMYVDNIDDKRGEMRLDPLGFAKSVMAQPEFAACMTKKVVTHVFADTATEDDDRAVEAQFAASGRLRDMVRVAALRYLQRRLAPASRPAAAASVALQQLVTSTCNDCHDFYKKQPPDQRELASMLEMVYLARMPKKGELASASRLELIRGLGAKLGRPSTTFLEDGFRSYSVHRPELMMSVIGESAAPAADKTKPRSKLRSIENGIDPTKLEYTPAFALELSVAAVQACEASEGASATAKQLAACAKRALDKRTGIRSTNPGIHP